MPLQLLSSTSFFWEWVLMATHAPYSRDIRYQVACKPEVCCECDSTRVCVHAYMHVPVCAPLYCTVCAFFLSSHCCDRFDHSFCKKARG